MNSSRKRSKKGHYEEKLIEQGVHTSEVILNQEEAVVVADRVQSRNDMIIATENEESLDKALAKKAENGYCWKSTPEKVRLYVITISTFIFGLFSIAFGILLILTPNPHLHSIRGGVIAIIIGIVMFVPFFYGITHIISSKIEKKKSKQNQQKEDPVGLTVRSLLDV